MRYPSNTILAIHCCPTMLFGALVSAHDSRITIHRYRAFPLMHREAEGLVLFNPTRIGNEIRNWYSLTRQPVPVHVSLAGPTLIEKIVALPTTHPTIDQLPVSHAPDWQWHWSYLYSLDTMHYFYLTGMRRSLLFQYKLLAITYKLPLHTITTASMALLSLYRYKMGAAYRASHLADHLERARTIEKLFSFDDLERIAQVPAGISLTHADTMPLLITCGLFTGEIA